MRPLHLNSLRPLQQTLRPSPSLRNFHSTPHRPFLEPCLSLTHTLLTELHQVTHLSWPLTIPLFALGVRVLLLPLSLKGRRTQVRLMELRPIITAYRSLYTKQVLDSHRQAGPTACKNMITGLVKRKSQEVYARNNATLVMRLLPILQIPVFLVVIETIRRMCGTREGLLGLLAKQIVGETEEGALSTSTPSPAQILESEPGLNITSPATVGLEPSLALEGNWDLLAPYPALSFLLAGILYANIALPTRFSDRSNQDQPPQSLLQRRVTRALKVVCLAVGPLTLQLPAAMTLYWCCSGGSALVVSMAVNAQMPLPKHVRPCRNNSLLYSYDQPGAYKVGGPSWLLGSGSVSSSDSDSKKAANGKM
jgi:inner membrane protein COX18